MPITTAGDRDRTKPFGEIGSRGVFVKELEEALLDGPHRRRRALGEGHDVDRHRRTRRRRVPRARRSARRARAARTSCGRACGSAPRRCAGARSCSRSSRSSRSSRCAATSTRGLRKRGERGLDAIVLAACGLDRLGLGGRDRRAASIRSELLPEAGQGALALQVRAGEEELVAHVDDAETRRRVEPERAVRRGDRRRLPRAGRRAPRRRAAAASSPPRTARGSAPHRRRPGRARPRARGARRAMRFGAVRRRRVRPASVAFR